jgi:hypothetical protein
VEARGLEVKSMGSDSDAAINGALLAGKLNVNDAIKQRKTPL